jgi:ABC-type cobalamin transport system permease subunit
MLVFIIIGLLGLALAVASLLLGDFLELADGALSGTSLGAGGMLFGATGMVVLSSGLEPWVAYPAGLVVGILVIVLVNVLLKRLRAGDDDTPVSLVGIQGSVTSDVDRGPR